MHSLVLGLLLAGPGAPSDAAPALTLVELGRGPRLDRPPVHAPEALAAHVRILSGPRMGGRLTGTEGERKATAYVAAMFEALGLEPAGDEGGWFQSFEFVSGVSLEPGNQLALSGRPGPEPRLDEDWRPIGFSATGTSAAAGVVFAGYGVSAPEEGEQSSYDAYTHLSASGKWVMVFRFLPEDTSPERRQHLGRYGSLRYKAMEARDQGAAGLLVVSGPRSQVKSQLVPLRFDAAMSGTGIPVLSISDEFAQRLLGPEQRLESLQRRYDGPESTPGFELRGPELAATVALGFRRSVGRNVLARRVGTSTRALPVVVGAHVDHLGRGEHGDSLAHGSERGQLHPGADDNASGVAALIGVARRVAAGPALHRTVVLAAWSGEELGLYGSNHYVGAGAEPPAAVYLNMDMVGRLDRQLILQGVGSSPLWPGLIQRANRGVALPIRLDFDTYLPTDATSFYLARVPILAAFTGAHSDYHSPRDTADRIDALGLARIAELMGNLTLDLARRAEAPPYQHVERPKEERRGGFRAYLGTIPDYAGASDTIGVPLSGATKGSPAEKGGIQPGDVLVELAGQRLQNIYDFMKVLDRLKIGAPVSARVRRAGHEVGLELVPESRQ